MQSSFSTIKQMYNDGFQKMNRFCLPFFDYFSVLHVFGWYRKLYWPKSNFDGRARFPGCYATGTPIKTIYRKVLFTSLLFKVAGKYSFLRIGGLTTASLYSGGKKKLLTWITGSWKSFKPLSSRKLLQRQEAGRETIEPCWQTLGDL